MRERIELITEIKAPAGRCFDLARSIDLHKLSVEGTGEEAIAGVTSGLIGPGEEVTWRARHFGIIQTLTSRITEFEYPFRFRDEMVRGAFKSINHLHEFVPMEGKTRMRDDFEFEVPYSVAGWLFTRIILYRYLKRLLKRRNHIIKTMAESGRWNAFVK